MGIGLSGTCSRNSLKNCRHQTKSLRCTPNTLQLLMSCIQKQHSVENYHPCLKPARHLVTLYADRRKSPSVPGAAIAIFADRRDRRIKSPISDMSDIGD